MTSVAALIPAYNECDRIAETIAAVKTIPEVKQIIVIDDGSTDNTSVEAERAGADKVLRLESNVGKGGALLHGMKSSDAEIFLMLDADIASSAKIAGLLLEPVIAKRADMTIATLPTVKKSGGFGLTIGLARWGVKRYTGREIRAPLSGQRALRREIVDRIPNFDPGFGVETGLTIDALRMGYTIEEVPVEISHRVTGRTLRGFIHRGRQFVAIARALIVRALGMRKLDLAKADD